jgi:hypothetical protein
MEVESMKHLMMRRERLRELLPTTLEDEDLDKVAGGTVSDACTTRAGDPDLPSGPG